MWAVKIHGALYGPIDDISDTTSVSLRLSRELEGTPEIVPIYDPEGDIWLPFRKEDTHGTQAEGTSS